jgi:hypothetical protein
VVLLPGLDRRARLIVAGGGPPSRPHATDFASDRVEVVFPVLGVVLLAGIPS